MKELSASFFSWDQENYNNFGNKTQRLKHQLDLLNDDSLIKLLDSYPREWLQCFTMGYNPEDFSEWKAVHIDDSSGKEILEAVKKGRFWINIINIDRADSLFTDVIEKIYLNISDHSPHLKNIKVGYSALILSSPGIQVYYHVDAEANMLWHLKGEKKVWVYPRTDKLSPQNEVEKIIAQEQDEELPYQREFDDSAECFTLQAGDVISWPIHSPHRVENVTLNLSLATSYSSKENRRLNAVHCANYFILNKLGAQKPSINHEGVVAFTKAYAYLILNKLRVFKRKNRTENYKTDLKIDHQEDNGMVMLEQSSFPVFSTKG